jgi:hypothetical protein
LFEGGYFSAISTGLTGLVTNPPPQLGQTFFNTSCTQLTQKVHSKLHIIASVELTGNGLLQFSQVGRSSSIRTIWLAVGGKKG